MARNNFLRRRRDGRRWQAELSLVFQTLLGSCREVVRGRSPEIERADETTSRGRLLEVTWRRILRALSNRRGEGLLVILLVPLLTPLLTAERHLVAPASQGRLAHPANYPQTEAKAAGLSPHIPPACVVARDEVPGPACVRRGHEVQAGLRQLPRLRVSDVEVREKVGSGGE